MMKWLRRRTFHHSTSFPLLALALHVLGSFFPDASATAVRARALELCPANQTSAREREEACLTNDPLRHILARARTVSTSDFGSGDVVEVDERAAGQYKLVNIGPHGLGAFGSAVVRHDRNTAEQYLVKELLPKLLPHLRAGAGTARPVQSDELVVMSLSHYTGAPLHYVHWDSQWAMFPEAAGIQVWLVLHPPGRGVKPGQGNMFVAKQNVFGGAAPSTLVFVNGSCTATRVYHACGNCEHEQYCGRPRPLKAPGGNGSTVSAAHACCASLGPSVNPQGAADEGVAMVSEGFEFEYLDAKAGDALIFSKRTMHMSDPRPHWHGQEHLNRRSVVVLRIIVRPAAGAPLALNTSHERLRMFFSRPRGALSRAEQHFKDDALTGDVLAAPKHRDGVMMLNQSGNIWPGAWIEWI